MELTQTATRLKGQWTANAIRVMEERYLKKEHGKVRETPDEMFSRVARAVAKAELKWGKTEIETEEIAGQFYEMMVRCRFMPNSPTLMNAGKENGLQFSACFVLPVSDSIRGIFDAIKNAAIIHQSGGGTGFSFSRLRSKGSIVSTTQGEASGPVSFLKVFDAATNSIKQGGTRRGANMGILQCDHPDIMEFIFCKRQRQITNFNISVAITDSFMEKVQRGEDYDLIAPHTGKPVGRLNARKVFDEIVESAWQSGDPGLIFMERVNQGPSNPVPKMGPVEATNPCGEQPLYPNEACNLGSLNLMAFAVQSQGVWDLDWVEMEKAVRLSVRFLDDVIDVNPYPLLEIDEAVKSNRRIGLGVMGWAHLLFRLGISYESEEALSLGRRVMQFINQIGHEESERLAEVRGPFPNWADSIYKDGKPLRNSTVTTIAPTGTISIIAGCSSGIEPIFALAFQHIVGDRKLDFVDPVFEAIAKEKGFYSPALREEVMKAGSLAHLPEISEEAQRVFRASHEIPPDWHIRTQGAFQEFTDNAVSKTINLPNSATQADVEHAYLMAYQLKCLGITVFRDGCLDQQVLNIGVGSEATKETPKVAKVEESPKVKPRPYKRVGATMSKATPFGTAHITMNDDEEGPAEVFITIGKAGSDVMAMAEGYGRSISLYLRTESILSRVEKVKEYVSQLRGIGGSRSVGFGDARVASLPDAIARAMAEHWLIDVQTPVLSSGDGLVNENGGNGSPKLTGNLCPECGGMTLAREEGCQKCHSCGFSEC
ncbi:MAG TPA: vitamin B12-dependent ribonucleotide reductase [Nitrospiria bacterium]|jgi:ribonucleoside-diphosphate reductase alpha chain|nr:vitamin B12-dependent ribonucleotide reductase [Nitrospiria bacterium]